MVHNAAYLYNRSLEYLDGLGVAQDEVRAFQLCEKAAGAGLHDAVLAMGWHYLNGAGVEKDVKQAQWWYKKSAKQREPRAMFSLGQMANSAANYESAMTWFQRASELGHVRSLYWMAKLYLRGQGVERDERKAAALLQQAAAARDPEARRFLRYQSWCQKTMKKRAEKGTAD